MTKILCIEDEADIRQLIVEELADAGYETVEAANGRADRGELPPLEGDVPGGSGSHAPPA